MHFCEVVAVVSIGFGKAVGEAGIVDFSALEPAFLEDRHRFSGYGLDTSAYDFALQCVELVMFPVGQLNKRNSLGNFNNVDYFHNLFIFR